MEMSVGPFLDITFQGQSHRRVLFSDEKSKFGVSYFAVKLTLK